MIRQAPKELQLKVLEERIQEVWKEKGIYNQLREGLEEKPGYYFLDGPPYASGSIHLGTAWNKIIKDSLLRYLSMKGYNVRKQPGWDCHGLPIEVKVEKELGIENKKDIDKDIGGFITACRDWAVKHIEIMTRQFKRLGVWMDWDSPYMTLENNYIESAWWTIKKAEENGLLTQDLRVVSWCPRCQTALAEAELEYSERTDPSIYVKFQVKGREDEFILIWTTTPWTLVGNLAIMVHPDFDYVKAQTSQGKLILARELLPLLRDKFELEYEVVDEFRGRELEGLEYLHPLQDFMDLEPPENAYRVILADFVSLGEGTGCVHSAPGHGPEDFEAGRDYGIPPLCPVDGEGKFTALAGKYWGMVAKKDDKVIVKDLSKKGMLLKSGHLTHRYGHCWRCKSPILYRATEQWFIEVSQLKDNMLEEIERAEWVPEWAGSSRFRDWVENARDWAISRQRYWGIPLPVWVCSSCGKEKVVGTREELNQEVEDLHRPYVDEVKFACNCGGEMVRVEDVLDVWFDSGVAPWASLDYPANRKGLQNWYPVKFITEGHDQTRGWFYSQLGCGLLAFGEIPYRRVLVHGFTLDEKGEKMSKSLGNVVTPEEVVEGYGADVLRFYVLWANKPWDDLKFNWEEVRVVAKMFNILWNTLVFSTTYMSIDSFDPGRVPPNLREKCREEDKWLLSRLHTTLDEVEKSFQDLNPYEGCRSLYHFIVEDLSRWYIPLVRPRTWVEKESIDKIAAYSVLYRTFCNLSKALAPITPHLAEEIYHYFLGGVGIGRESVHLEKFPLVEEHYIDRGLEKNMGLIQNLIEASYSTRDRANLKRRWPAKRLILYPSSQEVAEAVESLEDLVKSQANALSLVVRSSGDELEEARLVAEPNYSALGPEFKSLAPKVAEFISSGGVEELKGMIGSEVSIEGEKVELREEHINFRESLPETIFSADFDQGTLLLDVEKSEEVMEIGFAREVVRRIQEMRKEMNLNIEAFIEAGVEGDEEIIGYLEARRDYISRETRAREFNLGGIDASAYSKEWNISGRRVKISVRQRGCQNG